MDNPGTKIQWHDTQTGKVVSGAIRSGKSSTLRALIVSNNLQRRIFFDPKRDFMPYAQTTVYTAAEMEAYLADVENDHPFSVCYVPKDLPRPQALAACCREAERLEDSTVIADELHSATRQHEVDPEVVRYVREMGHINGGFWGCSQQPHDICLDIRSQLNAFESYYLLLTEFSDLDILTKRRGKQFSDAVKMLPKLHGFRLQPDIVNPEPFIVDPRGAGKLYSPTGQPLNW